MLRSAFVAGAVLVAAGGFALSACGSSSSSSTSTSSAGSASSANSASASSSVSSASASISVSGGSFCTQVVSVVAQLGQLSSGLGAAAGTAPSLAGIKQLIATEAGALDALDSSAPSEIANDFHTLRTAIDQANTQVQGATTIQQLGTAFSSFSTPAVSSASKNVSNYVGTSCGIKTSSSST